MRLESLRETTSGSTNPSLFPEYFDDPVGFAQDILGIRLWGSQCDIALSVSDNARTAARSGHKVGKSVLGGAAIPLWWVMTRERGKVIMTSSSAVQVKTILWAYLRKFYNAAGGDERFRPGDRYGIPKDPSTGLVFDDERSVYGFSTDTPERMQGHSGDQILFLIDEASGFPDEIYEAIQGNMAGGGRVLALGNPTKTVGFFYDAFNGKRRLWSTFHIDSRTTPNITGDGEPIPGLAGQPWVDLMIDEYGGGSVEEAERHPLFQIRVAGNFPEGAVNQVVSLGMIERAENEWTPERPMHPLVLGVDVARFGDDASVIQPVRGDWADHPVVVRGLDSVDVAGKVLEVVRDKRRHGDEVPVVKVDAIGIGSGVVDHLARSREVRVIPVNVGESCRATTADGQPKYTNLRSEVWFAVREWLERGGRMPSDSQRDEELMAPTYSNDTKLRIKVESKDAIKSIIGRSPDRADALGLAVWGLGGSSASAVQSRESLIRQQVRQDLGCDRGRRLIGGGSPMGGPRNHRGGRRRRPY